MIRNSQISTQYVHVWTGVTCVWGTKARFFTLLLSRQAGRSCFTKKKHTPRAFFRGEGTEWLIVWSHHCFRKAHQGRDHMEQELMGSFHFKWGGSHLDDKQWGNPALQLVGSEDGSANALVQFTTTDLTSLRNARSPTGATAASSALSATAVLYAQVAGTRGASMKSYEAERAQVRGNKRPWEPDDLNSRLSCHWNSLPLGFTPTIRNSLKCHLCEVQTLTKEKFWDVLN